MTSDEEEDYGRCDEATTPYDYGTQETSTSSLAVNKRHKVKTKEKHAARGQVQAPPGGPSQEGTVHSMQCRSPSETIVGAEISAADQCRMGQSAQPSLTENPWSAEGEAATKPLVVT